MVAWACTIIDAVVKAWAVTRYLKSEWELGSLWMVAVDVDGCTKATFGWDVHILLAWHC